LRGGVLSRGRNGPVEPCKWISSRRLLEERGNGVFSWGDQLLWGPYVVPGCFGKEIGSIGRFCLLDRLKVSCPELSGQGEGGWVLSFFGHAHGFGEFLA